MFSIQKKEENGFEKVILKDNSTNTYATVLPLCGAILHEFVSFGNGHALNVVESYTSAEDFKDHVESKGFLGCKLSPFVCRLDRGTYHFDGKKYVLQKFYLGKSALHGALYDRQFLITGEEANSLHASVTMKYEYRAEDPGYPFNYDCLVTWRLEENNRLTVITQCINKHERQIPLQDGWHPYFNLGDAVDELELQFHSNEMVEFNSDLIPTGHIVPYSLFNTFRKIGNIPLDNCFRVNTDAGQPICVLRNSLKKIDIEIYPEKSYPYLQIYIPPHRKSIAIENISGPPDAFNSGIGFAALEPGASISFKTSYRINHPK